MTRWSAERSRAVFTQFSIVTLVNSSLPPKIIISEACRQYSFVMQITFVAENDQIYPIEVNPEVPLGEFIEVLPVVVSLYHPFIAAL